VPKFIDARSARDRQIILFGSSELVSPFPIKAFAQIFQRRRKIHDQRSVGIDLEKRIAGELAEAGFEKRRAGRPDKRIRCNAQKQPSPAAVFFL
jgi:hypothetical protein